MQGTSINELKAQAVAVLGTDKVNELLASPITVAHKAMSAAYQSFKDAEAKAYENIVTLKMMGVKA